MPSSDYKVEIVDSSGEADMTVAIVGDQVVDIAGASDGELLGIHPAGTAVARSLSAWGIQPLDSDLTAIAALTTTAYGRAFLALADAAAGRTALGLGTASTHATGDFDAAGAAAAAQAASQPVDSDLTAIAALTTTAFGRSLLEQADAAAARATVGLDVLLEPLYKLSNGNYATGTNQSAGTALGLTSGALLLRYFTARSATQINTLATYVTTVHSGTGPTIERLGVFSVDADGTSLAALLASTPNDTALFGTLGKRTKGLSAAWTPVAGTRYAVGALCVTAGTIPQIAGITTGVTTVAEAPIASGVVTGLTDLPGSYPQAVATNFRSPYAEFIP